MNHKPPVRDEIPGYGTWLFEANRPREAHEYMNSWREEDRLEKKMRKADIPLGSTIEDLVDEVAINKEDIYQEERQKEAYREELCDTVLEKEKISEELLKTGQKLSEKTAAVDLLYKMIDRLQELLMKYGGHKISCWWEEVSSSGRIIKGGEEEHCNCGWYKTVKEEKLNGESATGSQSGLDPDLV